MTNKLLIPPIDPLFFKNLKYKKIPEYFLDFLQETYQEKWKALSHGDLEKWLSVLKAVSTNEQYVTHFLKEAITISGKGPDHLKENLMKLHPWRKGPFDICGTYIDSEWRSDMKWSRIDRMNLNLKNKLILDIGCGNGYYNFKMLQYENTNIIGIEPYWLYFFQFLAIQSFVRSDRLFVFPFSLDDLRLEEPLFDHIFSMGVLYHIRSPFEHFQKIIKLLKKKGTFILETLVIEGDEDAVLVPKDRYAMMRNVWFIPSVKALSKWLKRSGFTKVEVHDISFTSTEEQRETEWMGFQSLRHFLDPEDPSKTVEGYPAPQRALFSCKIA